MDVTLVSNGHGEDAVGTLLAGELRRSRPEVVLRAYPLVGRGAAYREVGVPVLGPAKELPSGGLAAHGAGALARDLRSGWVPMTAQHVRDLGRLRTDALLVVGDLYAQLLAAGVRANARFVYQPLVSAHQVSGGRPPWNRLAMERFTPPERILMRVRAHRVYVRDGASAAWLADRGLRHVEALGNPIVDTVAEARERNARGRDGHLALLPGSREHARRSLALMLEVVDRLGVDARLAWAPPRAPEADGWEWSGWSAGAQPMGRLRRGARHVLVTRGGVAEALAGAVAALGTSGTATEQAAAAGVPVLTFPIGDTHGASFIAGQKRLLGDALVVCAPTSDAVRSSLATLLDDRAAWEHAAEVGRQRMGPPGGSARIATDLLAVATGLGVG